MTDDLLPLRSLAELRSRARAVLDPVTVQRAAGIVADVEQHGEAALLRYAASLDGWTPGTPWWYDRAACDRARDALEEGPRGDLELAAARIREFALAQRATLGELDHPVPGGRAGHQVLPVERAGCYAPSGGAPLPTSVLMGVVTARAAGVREVWVATPRPGPVLLAAAAIAGADGVVAVGGAQAIAALTFGVGPVPPADVVVGPGNRWVTAGKLAVAGRVGIDFLAGPSELVVVADTTACPATVAADLLAQAEHDPDALVVLIATDPAIPARVVSELREQLRDFPRREVAQQALGLGGAVVVRDLEDARAAVDLLAPEHVQWSVRDPGGEGRRLEHAGAVFRGERSAEVFGDYGLGPNHVLPTSGGARHTGGLSVFTFLRVRTWIELAQPELVAAGIARLARLEGLEGHARSAEARLGRPAVR